MVNIYTVLNKDYSEYSGSYAAAYVIGVFTDVKKAIEFAKKSYYGSSTIVITRWCDNENNGNFTEMEDVEW